MTDTDISLPEIDENLPADDTGNVVELSDYMSESADSQALTFTLSNETFAMEVTRVEAIIDNVRKTRVPGADAFAPWVINVRGIVVPLIDLRHRFGLPDIEETIDTRTIVFEVNIDDSPTKVALIADSVSEVTSISNLDVHDLPEIGTKWRQEFVKGITRHNDNVVIVLDIEEVFNFNLNTHNQFAQKGENS